MEESGAARIRRESLDPVIRDAQMSVLLKVRAGEDLDWLERSVLRGIVEGSIGLSCDVESLVHEMREAGDLGS